MTRSRVLGMALCLLGLMFVLSLISYSDAEWPASSNPHVQNLCGRFGAYFASRSFFFFGQSAWLWPLAAFAFGTILMKGGSWQEKSGLQLAVSSTLLFAFTSGTMHLIWPRRGGPGGTLGMWLNDRLQYVFGGAGTSLILIFFGVLGVVGLLPKSVWLAAKDRLLKIPLLTRTGISALLAKWRSIRESRRPPIIVSHPMAAAPPPTASPSPPAEDSAAAYVPFIQKMVPFPMPHPTESTRPAVRAATLAAKSEKMADLFENVSPEEKEFQKGIARYRLPPLDLLKWPTEQESTAVDQKNLQQTGQILEDTLKNFGIDAQVVQIVPGPTVTLYEVLPAPGVAVSRIAAREADLKLALAASSLRIVAPIPGKSAVGVEVPNPKPQMVKIRELLAFEKFSPGSYTLPFALGKDILGKAVIVDLQKMPHVLIAGATGSGKSVSVAGLLITLLYRLSPAQLRLILIDPKRVELSIFSEIPHLLAPPILEGKSASRAFKWLMVEMENRYNILSDSGSKNLENYNVEQEKLGMPPLPYIVLVVDELADLMLSDGRVIEDAITRLAQMSRAVGIHLVLATQRPSVDVITGLIKANMPARIAFQVASQFDARTILDAKGAESLLGRGDMLFLSPSASKPIRLQGAYVDEEEIHRIVDFVRGQMKPMYVDLDAIPEGMMLAVDANTSRAIAENTEDIDPQLYEEAKRFTIMSRKGSTSNLQRKFRIGFNRAAKIIEMLEKDGIVGPNKGPTPRDVLVGAAAAEE